MLSIKVTCPNCAKDVVLWPEELFLIISMEEGGIKGSYFFDCHSCGKRVEKKASGRICDTLISAGAEYEVCSSID